MLRRASYLLFGALPASLLAVMLTAAVLESRFDTPARVAERTVLELAALAGTSALWILAVRRDARARGRRDAWFMGTSLAAGIFAASVALVLPLWSWRALVLCPILTAFCALARVLRTLAPGAVQESAAGMSGRQAIPSISNQGKDTQTP